MFFLFLAAGMSLGNFFIYMCNGGLSHFAISMLSCIMITLVYDELVYRDRMDVEEHFEEATHEQTS